MAPRRQQNLLLPKIIAAPYPFHLAKSPNYDTNPDGTPKRRAETLGIILHSTRSGKFSREQEYQKTIDYMMQPGTVSSHRVIGILEGQHAQLVEDDVICWAQQQDNKFYLAIEFCQPRPTDPYSDWQIEMGIAVCVEWCWKYGIAPSTETIRRHSDTDQGKRNGKSDPGNAFPYIALIGRVRHGMQA